MPSCSLLISTYNWPEALSLCLESILRQSTMPGEIIICDDGSGKPTERVIAAFSAKSPVPVKHVWHPDEGFQLAKIRNRGFAAASSDYLIQADGDLVFHKDFVSDHLAFCRKGAFATGSRVLLSPATTSALMEHSSIEIRKHAKGDANFMNGLHLPVLSPLFAGRYKQSGKYKYYVKGCNMAFWKKDLEKVNGYNETFTGWGREDSELAIRLINAGIKKRFIKFAGICYHLYHREASREMEARNIKLMEDAITQKLVKSPLGMDQY